MKPHIAVRRIFAVLLFAILFQTLVAQPVLTLAQCLERGLAANYGVRLVRNETEMAANNATRANAGMLPQANLSAGYAGNLASSTVHNRATGQTTTAKGKLEHTLHAAIDLEWTLFDGFRMQADLQRLRQLKLIGETQTRIAVEDLVANLSTAYYDLVQQQARLANLASALNLSQERHRIAAQRHSLGSGSRLDRLQARVDLNADSAAWAKQRELLAAARITLSELMGEEQVDATFMPADTAVGFAPEAIPRESTWQAVLTRNALLLRADHNKLLSEIDYKKACARDYPYLKLNAGYGLTHNRYEAGANARTTRLGPDFGITLGYRLFDGNRKRERRNAHLAVENAALQRDQLLLSLRADFATLYQAYLNNRAIVALERENTAVARENHAIARQRYLLGDLPGIEMREAQQSLLQAKERLLKAEYDTRICEISIRQMSGQCNL